MSISKGYASAIGYSFTGKPLKDGFCHIVTYSTHVNLGFNRGALLPDPKGILVGKGSQFGTSRYATRASWSGNLSVVTFRRPSTRSAALRRWLQVLVLR